MNINTVIVGAQWGDEAKGKLVDALGQSADLVVRYAGGNNAGHTVDDGERIWKFHLLPSAILNPSCLCILGDGVVIDPLVLVEEIEALLAAGRKFKLIISERAHVIMPYHRLLDGLREKRLAGHKIGTTGRGIGPAYCDKASRVGIRIGELVSSPNLDKMLCDRIGDANQLLVNIYEEPELGMADVVTGYAEAARKLRPYVGPIHNRVYQAAKSDFSTVVFEGAQGTWLDPDYGTYPFVTSSHPIAGGACLGTGIGPRLIDRVIGVAKGYTTRVGEGPLPTEMDEVTAARIRERGKEFGTTTGRGRRIGHFDAMLVRLACRFNSVDFLSLGHLDVLCGEKTVRICTAWQLDGQRIEEMPARMDLYDRIEPVYEELPGWHHPVIEARDWEQLPLNCRKYIERIEELVECPIGVVSVGPRRDQTIWLDR